MQFKSPSRSRSRLHRSANDRYIAGVCGGIAEHYDFTTTGVRVLFGLLTLMFFPVAILGYIVLAMMLPVGSRPIADEENGEYIPSSPNDALAKARERFDSLDRRLQRLEDVVTSRDFELESRYREL